MVSEQEFERLKADYERLKTGIQELAILNEIATTISSTIDLDRIIETIVKKCITHFNVDQGNISLISHQEMAAPLQTMVRQYDSDAGRIPFRLDQQLIGWMLAKKEPLIINDISQDTRFAFLGNDIPYKSLICVAMMYKGKLIGVLSLFNKRNNESFDKNDLRLLSIIATESSQVIENARLLEEEKKLLSVTEELRISGLIQQKLLPSNLPDIKGYQVAASNIPAKEVGGDYYDVIKIDEHKFAFCFGDVSGKGMPAALLMSNLQATIRSLMLSNHDPALIVQQTNTLIHATTTSDKFITFFLGILDVKNNVFDYCNAGHDKPLDYNSGSFQELQTGGVPLGFLQHFDYQKYSMTFNQNQILVIYTDGVTEAMNRNEDEFGLDNVKSIVKNNQDKSAREILDAILEAIDNHASGAEQMDDITMIVLKKN
ncbi:MAG: SpoIIE family protein phosphatase [Calditrichae bacterium]|nr:SpoIIE family protein phosphatase [Calditrichota bacterium]MCB9058619.1 SpoIIE family protein phosphatase [Calditrichia bacterium]